MVKKLSIGVRLTLWYLLLFATAQLIFGTGMWFLATDKLVPSDDLEDHLAFVERLVCPEPGDDSRITELHDLLQHTQSRAHITCFWRGDPSEAAPQIPEQFKSSVAPLDADIETDFVAAL